MTANMTGVPSAMPTCWLVVTSPVASLCYASGSPDVEATT
jgi:hypothetical protein